MLVIYILALVYIKSIHHPKFPRTLVLTTKDKTSVPPYVMERFVKYSAGYRIHLFDDTECIEFLLQNYGEVYAKKFKSLTMGPHKADLFRYAYLYENGGLYMDIKTAPTRPLRQVFPDPTLCYLVQTTDTQLYNGIIQTPPKNPYIHRLLHNMLNYESNQKTYLRHCISAMKILKEFTLSGAVRVGHNPTRSLTPNVHLYKEAFLDKTHCSGKKDRYGYCVFMVDNRGRKWLMIRDPHYKANYN